MNHKIIIVLIFLLFLLFLIIIAYLKLKLDETIILGLLGLEATLYFGLLKQKIENDRLFKELFNEFNSKYDKRFNDLVNELKKDNSRIMTTKERNLVIDYFNLCSEEYLWRRKNRIPKDVWNSWKAGIRENLSIKQIMQVYDDETSSENSKKSYYGLVEELKK